MFVRRLVLALGVLSIGSVGAMAADMPLKAPPPIVVPPYSWTGCYIGINGGGVWKKNHYDISFNNPAFFAPAFAAGATPSRYNIDMDGGIVGGTVGCNYQISQFVIGAEVDYDWADVKGTTNINTTVAPFVPGFGSASEKLTSIGTARLRLGTTIIDPKLLLYITGGLAWGTAEYNYSFAFPATNELYVGSVKSTRFGWAAGAGGEYAFFPHWSVKLEALYFELDGTSFAAPRQTAVGPVTASHFVDTGKDQGWMLRAGLNYKF